MDHSIHDYIREALRSYDDYLAEQAQRCSEIERRLANMIRPGKVVEIHEDGQRVQVQSGDNLTPFIHWFATAAGKVSDYRCPSVGEQCVLLNYAGGEEAGQCWALCGVPCEQWPLPSSDPAKQVTNYGNGVERVVDALASKITVTVDTLHGTGDVSDSKRTMAADRDIYDGHDHPHGDPTSGQPNQKQG